MKSYPKSGPLGARKAPVGKSESEQLLEFGETVQLPGGLSPDRKFTRNYGTSNPAPSMPVPPSSLYDR